MKPPPPPVKVASLLNVSFRLTTQASEQLGRIQRYGEIARLETGMGAQGPRIVLLTPDALLTLNPAEKVALRRPMDPALRLLLFRRASAFALAWEISPADLWPGAKVVGHEKLRGIVCDIWELKEKGPLGGIFRAWLPRGKKKDFPLRLRADTAGANRQERMVRTVDALRCSRSRSGIGPGVFAVPKGYTVRWDNTGERRAAPGMIAPSPQ